ncbi:MAG: hypothetical protein KIT02_00950 [Devosia sp.]|uniref:SH3 domain-containing protein n=1 Tax=Devosia sp. TaxID=1871048 RepID=UPI0024CC7D65|nr:SH3 domain-containing protein [Devosia sp.]UYN99843.1 MAG: hypothetical protein KIT02_00950 [Devosia sp.]
MFKTCLRAAALFGLATFPLWAIPASASLTVVRQYPQLGATAGGITVKLRAGPGSFFPQIDTIGRGEFFIVKSCSRGWCVIQQQDGGPTGFMTDAYIVFRGTIHG